MEIFFACLGIIGGLLLLTYGGNILVDGSVSIARRFGISEAIIGLTIVAIGTSMPELIVSVLASISGNTDIAIGNVLGSNIANILLILGVSAIIFPIVLSRIAKVFDIPIVIASSIILLVVVSDITLGMGQENMISRIDGIILVTLAIIYILYSLRYNNQPEVETKEETQNPKSFLSVIYIIGGIGLLFVGGKILVDGAVSLALMFGLSQSIIGLTIVAIGTSTPELVTSIIAAKKGKSDIAIGNVVGSNIMNIFVILGVSSIIAPLPFYSTSYFDLMVVILTPILLLLLSRLGKLSIITRLKGCILLGSYIAYIIYLIIMEYTRV